MKYTLAIQVTLNDLEVYEYETERKRQLAVDFINIYYPDVMYLSGDELIYNKVDGFNIKPAKKRLHNRLNDIEIFKVR